MYRRQIEVIGKENQEILSQKSVLIVGAGGLGNIIAASIGCIGFKKIYIIDYDKIELHNLHRQFYFAKEDVSKSKVIMLSERVKKRCNSNIVAIEGKFSKDIDIDVDLIFDATDNFEVRREIDLYAKSKEIAWVYASVEELRGQVGLFKTTSFDIFAIKNHEVKGQMPPMVNLIGSIASMVGIKYLIGEDKEILYYVDFSKDLEIKKFHLG